MQREARWQRAAPRAAAAAAAANTCRLPASRAAGPHTTSEPDHGPLRATPLPRRAYKLGKKRWSYNSVELELGEAPGGGGRTAAVAQVVHADGSRLSGAHEVGGGYRDVPHACRWPPG